MRNPKWKVHLPANHAAPKLPHFATVIPHPKTGNEFYCQFPSLNLASGEEFPAGDVKLLFGKCHGTGGFGVHHIWDRHFKHLTTCEDAIAEISAFVASVLCTGAEIYHDDLDKNRDHRVMVLRSKIGVAIVELRGNATAGYFYSVVSAYKRQNANGSLVGAVL